MLNRLHARTNGALHAFRAVRVGGDGVAVVFCGGDNRCQFFIDEQRRVAAFGQR